jgi:electron transfer flavoprotein alpha/beta subunit
VVVVVVIMVCAVDRAQSIDSDNGQTPQMLAGLLGWPQAMFASKIVFADDKKVDRM